MKPITALLLTAMLLISATGMAQKITFVKKDATLKQIFAEIYKQTGYSVLLSGADARSNQKVGANFTNTAVEEVIKTVLRHQPLDYTIEGKTIVIRDKESSSAAHLQSVTAPDSTFLVTGRVVNERGRPLAGASYNVVTSLSSMVGPTGADGTFKFSGAKGNTVTIGYVGYATLRMIVTTSDLGDIIMVPAVDSLQDIKIVIGYGTTTKTMSTGNVSVITSEDIRKQPVTNVLQALQGRVAGMQVNQTNGFASAPFDLKVRGQNAMAVTGNMGVNNISEPLYIIDGVPVISGAVAQTNVGINQNGFPGPTGGQSPLFGLNPDDVESISVLKDADATAIYGARGANGVLLITTKKGKPGKAVVTAEVYTGLSLQTRQLHLMNTVQYLDMRKRAFSNDGILPEEWNGYDLLLWDSTRYTDWQKEFLQTAHTTNAQLSLSGGDSKTTFRLNGGFNTQSPPFKGNYKEQRVSVALNVNNNSFNNKLTTAVMVNFSSTTSNLPSLDPTSLIFLAPNAPPLLNDKGDLNFDEWRAAGSLPYQAAYLKRPYHAGTINLISNVNLRYHILPELQLAVSMGYNMTRQNQLSTSPSGSFDPTYSVGREASFGNNNSRTWIIEPTLVWNKSLNRHNLEVLAGATFQDALIEGSDITARGFTSDATLENLAAASSFSTLSNYTNTKFESVYGRINYNYDRRYVINLNGRRDGSSRFASGRQFGNFTSAGAAWIFSQEDFSRDHLSFLSLGKIRASYGLVGGDGLGDYQYLSSFRAGSNPYQNTPAFELVRLANDQFGWTTSKKLEVAIALGFLQNKISTELSWYRNRSGNQLVSEPLPFTTGFSSVVTNLPALVQNTGLELTLQTQNITGKNFQWTTSFNISANRNKLLSFPNLSKSAYANTYAIGRSINSRGMMQYAGVDPATGYYLFTDINKDSAVDIYGNKDYIYTDNTPSFFGGMGHNLTYKNIQISLFFTFTKQKGVLRLSNQYPGSISGGMGNQLVLDEQLSGKPVLDNLTTTTYRNDLFNYYNSDATWVDASYIRLQNASLSYNLPTALLSKAGMQNAKVYVQCQNLWTITGYKGPDPASPGSFSLPPRKIITAGIQLTF